MTQKIYRFFLSFFLYWFVASFAGHVLEIPEKIVNFAAFIPPVLGLMWGIPAASGVYFGALFALPELQNFLSAQNGIGDWILYFARAMQAFIAGYLPYVLWHKRPVYSEESPFLLSLHTLKKFLVILFITFVATSVFRAFTVTEAELKLLTTLIGAGKSGKIFTYVLACFVNDFFLAVFFDLAWFFLLVGREYSFQIPGKILSLARVSTKGNAISENYKFWLTALAFYMLFPLSLAHIDKYQIYGMNNVETWLRFVAECVAAIDVYLVLMLYLLLRYRRSIMLEVVFLVTQTVFFTATVLGWSNSVGMDNFIKKHTEESLHAMSVICRERLYRTFFCVRQAVNGMKLQALDALESYDRLAGDAAYRQDYLARMRNRLNFIAVGIDGSISYYLRLTPEIAGTKGGFSMQREEARWEGAISSSEKWPTMVSSPKPNATPSR